LPCRFIGLVKGNTFFTAEQTDAITSMQIERIGRHSAFVTLATKKVTELNAVCESSLSYKRGGLDCAAMMVNLTH
jgi:hypothetical protein